MGQTVVNGIPISFPDQKASRIAQEIVGLFASIQSNPGDPNPVDAEPVPIALPPALSVSVGLEQRKEVLME